MPRSGRGGARPGAARPGHGARQPRTRRTVAGSPRRRPGARRWRSDRECPVRLLLRSYGQSSPRRPPGPSGRSPGRPWNRP
ncbi:hypothetical protein DLE60_31795 [Micromonospora globispora]|uniref:Uncharacterized protein n=1 Tax=Micromonospora globispora TaxID=1450148 RepID=A0A317KFB4_9ACTN|nr:hypothetical protein DLE60_31795 [Micromonospora globispora]PWU52170.1 hypothetical protein DLJ46_03585 [Micromonospora globispora]RQX04728.1 hypothetical protein DKL51_03245 [Micromonospora globispora]